MNLDSSDTASSSASAENVAGRAGPAYSAPIRGAGARVHKVLSEAYDPGRRSLQLFIADTVWKRLKGLMGLPQLGSHEGLWLRPCQAVHTFGMRFPIDVVFLNNDLQVIKVVHELPPNRAAACWAAHSVIELPAGYCQQHARFEQDINFGIQHALRFTKKQCSSMSNKSI